MSPACRWVRSPDSFAEGDLSHKALLRKEPNSIGLFCEKSPTWKPYLMRLFYGKSPMEQSSFAGTDLEMRYFYENSPIWQSNSAERGPNLPYMLFSPQFYIAFSKWNSCFLWLFCEERPQFGIRDKVTSRTWVNHVPHINESCPTYTWVMSHIWMCRSTLVNESRQTRKNHVPHMTESCPTYECVTSHI